MPENFNIQSLHGRYFTAEICFINVAGRVSVMDSRTAYLCHDNGELNISKSHVKSFGYKYVWPIGDMQDIEPAVQNLKILPSPLEYHKLLTEIFSGDSISGYESVIKRIGEFLGGIGNFDPKNLGNQ